VSGYAIRSFVGPNGGGKTLAAVELSVLPAWREGRPVVANLRLYPEKMGFAPSLYVPLESWRQIPDLADCALVLDEISSVLPSRSFSSVPPQLVRVLNQLRKGDVTVAWTAPNWMRCDVLLREVTQAVTTCVGSWSDQWQREPTKKRFPARLCDEAGVPLPYQGGWPPNRLFRWMTFDALEFDEFSYSTVKDVKPIGRRLYWRPRHDAHLVYKTLEGVDLLDHLDDVGLCVSCGGHRSRPKCKCGERPAAEVALATEPTVPPLAADKRDELGPIKPRRRRAA
jgi:Zonular occludens toxin (Zot)